MDERIELLAKRKTLVLRTRDYSLLRNSIERKLSKAENYQERLSCKKRAYTRQNRNNFLYLLRKLSFSITIRDVSKIDN